MSIRSLTDLAIKRDVAPPDVPIPSDQPDRTTERTRDAFISAIPAEVVAAYTALTGGVLAIFVKNDPNAFLSYRWALLAATVVFTPLAVLVTYRRKFNKKKEEELAARQWGDDRREPWMEMSAATVAAAAWVLAAPGSPLFVALGPDVSQIAAGAIPVVASVLLWAGFGEQLRIGSALPGPEVPERADSETGAVVIDAANASKGLTGPSPLISVTTCRIDIGAAHGST